MEHRLIIFVYIAAPCDFSDEDMSVIDGELSSASSGGGKKGPGLMGTSGNGGAGGVSLAGKKANDRKSARARTVLSEKQLNILKTCYSANPRPDALMKEQLVEMTGLSPRVIRVWFQNKRCKDKKLQNRLMEKQMQRETVRKFSIYMLKYNKIIFDRILENTMHNSKKIISQLVCFFENSIPTLPA